MINHDFSKITVLTVHGYPPRLRYIYAVGASLLSMVKNCEWRVGINYTGFDERSLYPLMDLAKINNNKITITHYPDTFSLARCKAGEIISMQDTNKWVMMLDDDVIITDEAARNISQTIRFCINPSLLFLFGFFDVYNNRNHKDWNTTVYNYPEDVADFRKNIGEKFMHFHLWNGNFSLEAVNTVGGSFIVHAESLIAKGIVDKMLIWKKGLRGYDAMVCGHFEKRFFIVPSTCYHLGIEDPFYNSVWENIDENSRKLFSQ